MLQNFQSVRRRNIQIEDGEIEFLALNQRLDFAAFFRHFYRVMFSIETALQKCRERRIAFRQ